MLTFHCWLSGHSDTPWTVNSILSLNREEGRHIQSVSCAPSPLVLGTECAATSIRSEPPVVSPGSPLGEPTIAATDRDCCSLMPGCLRMPAAPALSLSGRPVSSCRHSSAQPPFSAFDASPMLNILPRSTTPPQSSPARGPARGLPAMQRPVPRWTPRLEVELQRQQERATPISWLGLCDDPGLFPLHQAVGANLHGQQWVAFGRTSLSTFNIEDAIGLGNGLLSAVTSLLASTIGNSAKLGCLIDAENLQETPA
ncbi:uncharacterized protein N7482_005819 [Penicillium canariense]|uniref:Uncharacterized protein n=1 Tax=Penicillium canariense TaxID=189055 RepID=A0A9W9I5A7_9EURO|nr:uncharacterized protein N7482_005819 [Penicillium canariense]KAJ5167038.1 hypothetical protein N7482_005819 [Penicillium canariense]